MVSQEHVGQQFHGARREITNGVVLPATKTGVHPASSLGFGADHPDHAFATPSEHIAWGYAHSEAMYKDHPINHDPDPKHRARVYAVAPAADQHGDYPGDSEIKSKEGYKIIAEHQSREGETGTIPSVNWNAFKGVRSTYGGRGLVHSGDHNQSTAGPGYDYTLDRTPATKAQTPTATPSPGQLSVFSGRSVEEHEKFEQTPGIALRKTGLDGVKDFMKDPVSMARRKKQRYHSVDEALGTTV